MKETISSIDIRTWSMLGQRGTFFGIALPEIAETKDNLKVLTADLSLLSGITRFEELYPEKFLNTGIAEQNMIGIAAGLAMSGRCVFATTYASFIAVRSLEHVRQHLSHLKCNIKIIGTGAGVVAAKSGVSHWATEDIAFVRALPGLTVLSPADALEAYKMAHWCALNDKPVYVRISGGLNCPVIHRNNTEITIGKGIQLIEGEDVAVISTGLMVNNSLKAIKILQKSGLNPSLYDFHTIKPLDSELLDDIYRKYKLIVSVEEHNIVGGLGSAIAEHKATRANTPRQVFIGIQDRFCAGGSQNYVWEQNGLSDNQIAERILKEINGHL